MQPKRKPVTENQIVQRAAQADIDYWVGMNNGRCPNCCKQLFSFRQLKEFGHQVSQEDVRAYLYPHMVGECPEPFIGPGFNIRYGQNVDAPLADALERTEVKARPDPQRKLLKAALYCIALAVVLLWWMFR